MTLGVALALEWLLGDPRTPWHPVALFGSLAARIERHTYADRRAAGLLAWTLAVWPATAALAVLLHTLERPDAPLARALAVGVGALALWSTLGWRSLLEHVRAVAGAASLSDRRRLVARIVGRDVRGLSDPELRRAALESLAENASDAVVGPLFWAVLGGPAAAVGYRLINTADALWGHRSPRYRHFGWAAARADDVASWVPARLTAALYLVVSGRAPSRQLFSQARAHPSPNAGWPESALAHVMGVRLGGPVPRQGYIEARPWMGPANAVDPDRDALRAGLRLTRRTLIAAGICGGAAWL